MASTTPVSPEVRRFLSANGKKGAKIGGNITRQLVQLGKQAAEDEGRDWHNPNTNLKRSR